MTSPTKVLMRHLRHLFFTLQKFHHIITSRALLVIVDVHSLYTTCSCLINGRAYLHSGMVSIIFSFNHSSTIYCCKSLRLGHRVILFNYPTLEWKWDIC